MEKKELATTEQNLPWVIDYDDPKIKKTLQMTVARGTTDEEFWIFANYCKSKALNPLAGEVWCIKTEGYTGKDGRYHDGRLQIMTGINGYWRIANSNPEFDGENCTFEPPVGKPVTATATIWRKDRTHPHVSTVYFEEYYRPGFGGKPSNWDKMPRTMLEKVAYAHALRKAFPQEFNGTYIPEEMPPEYEKPESVNVTPAAQPEPIIEGKTEKPEYIDRGFGLKPTLYQFKAPISREQEIYLQLSGFRLNAETGIWQGPQDLGPRLEQYKVRDLENSATKEKGTALAVAESLPEKKGRGRLAKSDNRSEKWMGKAPKEEARLVDESDSSWIVEADRLMEENALKLEKD